MPYKFNPFTGTLDEVGTGGGGGTTNLDGLTDVTITAPSDWEVLGYNATSGLWENTNHIHVSVAGNLYVHIKNTDSVQLDKGTPFYITGTVGASDQVEVQAADNTDPAKGPAIGLVEDNLPVNAEGNGVLVGEIYNYDTATPGWSTNDALYVSAAGALTNAQPTSGYRQVVGYVGRVHASTGTIIVLGNQKDPVAGSDTEIQFNDNGGFGASADLTWDDTNKELGVGGDINLDDGGTFSTTLQSVTPTANRTISFPDATGTVALVSGTNGTIQYNDAGTLKGNSDFTVDVDWDNPATTFTALKVNVPDVLQGAVDSKLLDLQSNAASRFAIGQAGELTLNADGIRLNETYIYTGTSAGTLTHRVYAARGTQASPSVSLAGDKLIGYAAFPRLSTGFSGGPGARMQFVYRGDAASNTRATDIEFETSIGTANIWPRFGIVNTGGVWIQADGFDNNTANRVFLNVDAANILAQRNGTASQTFRLYNTWGNGGVDFERTSITRDSSGLVIDAQKGGTGADPTNLLDVKVGGSTRFSVAQNYALRYGTGNFGITFPSGYTNILDYDGNTIISWQRKTTNIGINLLTKLSWGTGYTSSDIALDRDSAGVLKVTDGSTGTGYVKQTPVLVSALPAAATVGAGTRGFVSDATATTFASVVAGSGTASTAGTVPVYSDGTDWRIG